LHSYAVIAKKLFFKTSKYTYPIEPSFSSDSRIFFGKIRGLLDEEEEPTGLDGETSDGFQSLSDDDDIDSDNEIDIDNDVDGDEDDEFDEEGFGEDSEDEEVVFNKKPAPVATAAGSAQSSKKGGEMRSPKEKKKKNKKDTMEDEMDFAEMEAAASKSKKKKFPKANTHPVSILTHIVRPRVIIRFSSMQILWSNCC
jgi:hypothetical protein